MKRTRVSLRIAELILPSDVSVDITSLTAAIESELGTLVQSRGLPSSFSTNTNQSALNNEVQSSGSHPAINETFLASGIAGAFWK